MWPHWHLFEPTIRAMAGLGVAADAADPDRYDEVSRQTEVLVVGGGVAGAQAALAAARAGARVLLLEATPHLAEGDALRAAGVECQTRCTVYGLYDHGLATAVQTVGGAVRERLWKIRAQRTVIAIGAFERPMLFPDNDRPGVMLASAVEQYAVRYGVACGRRIVVATACDSGYRSAHVLKAAGIDVAAIVDVRERSGAEAPAGVAVHRASAIVAVEGRRACAASRSPRRAEAALHTDRCRLHRQRRRLDAGGEPVLDGRRQAALGRRVVDVRAGTRAARHRDGGPLRGRLRGSGCAGQVPADNRPSSAALHGPAWAASQARSSSTCRTM
jgi:NADPH-dependent 2,4-dienoyl-CoA reductase/sulfur reductase-like enzyme